MSLPDFFHQKMSIYVAFPRDYKKKHAAKRRTFSAASHLKTRIHIILHCKTCYQHSCFLTGLTAFFYYIEFNAHAH